jgi:threonine dehydrogenase-like Zn-dependent dehydrogenase
LRVLAAGICGSDVPLYANGSGGERILGHENVGVIEQLGPLARERWDVREGDLVALEEYLPCGHCPDCRSGEYRSCLSTDSRRPGALRYGATALTVEPGLWGGYSQFQYLHPRAVLHRVPAGVDPRIASMALPIGNGFQWAYLDGGAGPGRTVVVQGPGQQGLACVIAAKAAGATVVVSGITRDRHRLEVARALGADVVVDVERDSLREAVLAVTAGALADLVLDVSAGDAREVVAGAVGLVRKRGTLLLAAYKGKPLDAFPLDEVIRGQINVRGVRGHSFRAVEMALALMASRRIDFTPLATHTLSLDETDRGLRLVGGEIEEDVVHVAIDPWR